MLRLAALFFCCATQLFAGAWPREKGTGFSANSIELNGFSLRRDLMETPYYSSFYFEYGLTQSLTIGLHGGHGSNAELGGRIFARLPLGRHETHKFAAELSLGVAGDVPTLGLGVQYGRALQLWQRNGWISAESRFDFIGGTDGFTYQQSKLDLTFGLTHPNGMKTMAQMFMTKTHDDLYATFAPMIVVPIMGRTKLEAGILYDVSHGSDRGLKLGIWQEF